MERYLIIVSRDRPELVDTLASSYGQIGEVEIHLDRRGEGPGWGGIGSGPERRVPTSVITDLEAQGFMVIPQR